MTRFRCAAAVLPGGIATGVDIEVAGGLITAIAAAGTSPADDVVMLSGLVYPGFADAHSHLFHRGLRGRTHLPAPDGSGSFWTWREAMYSLAGTLDPDSYFALARAALAELVCAGYTAVGEFHYLHHDVDGHPYGDPNAMGAAVIAAAEEVGIRLTLLDTLYLSAGFDPSAPLSPVQRRFTDLSVQRWASRVAALSAAVSAADRPSSASPGLVRIGAAAHSVRAVPPAALYELAGVLRDVSAGSLLHVHLSEQPQENIDALAATGLTPTGLLAQAGLLGPATSVVHATHLTDEDIALLGQAGSTAVICPTTEADLADGLPRAAAMAATGIPLACGGDQQVLVDPFAQARGIEWGERLATGRRGTFAPAALFDAASRNSLHSIGIDGGVIEVGRSADLVAVRTDSARTAGSRADQLVMSATAADVHTVVVNGRVVAREGAHVTLGDPGGLLVHALGG